MKTKGICFILLMTLLCSIFAAPVWAEEISIEDQIEQLEMCFTVEDYEGAVTCAEELLAIDPSCMGAYYYKAIAFLYLGEYEGAANTLEEILTRNPKDMLGLYFATLIHALNGDAASASAYAQKLIEMDIYTKGIFLSDPDIKTILDDPTMQFLNEIDVRVGGKLLSFDVAPQIVNDRTLVPMRTIFAELGAEVEWDAETATVTATKESKTVSLTINSTTAKINGEDYTLDAAPVIYQDRTLVPCRFVSDVFGAEVLWDADNLLVEILIEPTEGSAENYDTVYAELAENAEVIYVDGMYCQPYLLESTEGLAMIVVDTEEELQKMCLLDEASRNKLMAELAMRDYSLVEECEPVYTQFIYDGRIYFAGECYGDEPATLYDFKSYINGIPTNVVRQDKERMSYTDYYFDQESIGENPVALPGRSVEATVAKEDDVTTVADIAEMYQMSVEDFIAYYGLPKSVNGSTDAAEAEGLIPFWRMAQINGVTFEEALQMFGLPADFNRDATMREVYDAMPIGVLAQSYGMTYEDYLTYFELDPDDYDENTPYKEIREHVEKITDERMKEV